MNDTLKKVLQTYSFSPDEVTVKKFGTGHINSTWLLNIADQSGKYILQSINQNVFRQPLIIAENVQLVAEYLRVYASGYLFVASVKTSSGDEMAYVDGTYWRLTNYIENSVAYDTLTDPKQAYEAAVQFGRLSRLLNAFDASSLKPSIPGFHDLDMRYHQFRKALEYASADLRAQACQEIEKVISYSFIVDYFNSYKNSPDFPDRVMHHDTKISNMLFDRNTRQGICVIDLDTLMPGKFISDLGDMMRTYLCEFSENEPNLDKIFIRIDYFESIIDGYMSEMGGILTNIEKNMILFSGKYIIYMQAVRFITDFLSDNVYYPIEFPDQNLVRTKNQLKLLSEFFDKAELLQKIIDKRLNN